MRRKGWDVRLVPSAKIVHEARKTSHRNPRYLMWHLRSILRYLRTR
jgi:GT2 family glycosyltransferase